MESWELNQASWGVCGFVSAIQGALANHKTTVRLKADSYNTLFPVIKEFCRNNGDLASELLDFSAVFGEEYHYRNLDEVVRKMESDISMDDAVGLAMTGNAMTRLCRSLGFGNVAFHGTTATTNALEFKYTNTIYGLGMKTQKGNFRYGLLHWVYVDGTGKAMSWGKYDALQKIKEEGYDKITHYLPLG